MINQQPSQNPNDKNDLIGTLKLAFNKLMQQINVMLPASVTAVNDNGSVNVKPLITMLGTNAQQVERAVIYDVPMLQLGAGGYVLRFTPQVGDIGWVKACDRDISNFLNTLKMARPKTLRKHNFSDAVFMPHPMSGVNAVEGGAVLQSLDGRVSIALDGTEINIVANTVNVNAARVNLGEGGEAIARVGDSVLVNTSTGEGTITTGGANTSI